MLPDRNVGKISTNHAIDPNLLRGSSAMLNEHLVIRYKIIAVSDGDRRMLKIGSITLLWYKIFSHSDLS